MRLAKFSAPPSGKTDLGLYAVRLNPLPVVGKGIFDEIGKWEGPWGLGDVDRGFYGGLQ